MVHHSPSPKLSPQGAGLRVAGSVSRRSGSCERALRALLLVAATASLGIASCSDVPDGGRVIAEVNGEKITYAELVRQLEKQHGHTVLLGMIDEVLIWENASERGISLSTTERDAALERAAARVGSMIDLEVKLKRAGIPLESYRRKTDTDLLLDKIVLSEIEVTEEEIADHYRANLDEFERGARVRGRMMLFTDKASAEAVLEAVKTPGSDFAGLAKSLSDDAATRDKGGDMGYFEKEDYAPEISRVAFGLEPGEVSGVIEAPDGWVILQIEDRKPAGPLALGEVSRQIRNRLRREKLGESRGEWLVAARKSAELSIPRDALRAAVLAHIDAIDRPPMPGEL